MNLPKVIEIPTASTIDADVYVPGSKSIANRLLWMAALADGRSRLVNVPSGDDTRLMVEALRRLDFQIEHDGNEVILSGRGGEIPARGGELFLGNAGTAMRFLTAGMTLGHGVFVLDGVERMRQRPIGPLLKALNALGAEVTSVFGNDCPPVRVEASGLPGGEATMDGSVSSQFFSAVLLASPYARKGVALRSEGKLVSEPYVDMTLKLMERWGVIAAKMGDNNRASDNPISFFVKPGQCYEAQDCAIEPDASAATYFWGAAAVLGGRSRVIGLTRDSLQGDAAFVDVLQGMGCQVAETKEGLEVRGPESLKALSIDMNAMPDAAMTLAVLALFADGETEIRNIANLRVKETDRLSALCAELEKLGAKAETDGSSLRITPPKEFRKADIATYNDHRMAMSFAIAGLRIPGVRILNPSCVSKTFPDFFDALFNAIRCK